VVNSKSKTIRVGVGDCRVSSDRGSQLVTYSLGSCIAVVVYDPRVPVGGLLHFMLPDSNLNREKARENPFLFADTGIPLLLDRVREVGGERRRLIVRVAGGAQVLDNSKIFNIGEQNYGAVVKALKKLKLRVHDEAVGGSGSRTVRLELKTGRLELRTVNARRERTE
jgi:chemotaxis protein CheD